MDTIKLSACDITLHHKGILICTPTESHDISKVDADEIIAALSTLSKKRTIPVLVDHTISHSLSFDAMQILSSTRLTSALAFIFKTPTNLKAIEYFLEAGKPVYPVKLFTDHALAINWLATRTDQEQ